MRTRDDVVTLLHEAGLTGRGGAGFSTGVKVEALRDHRARLIVNACDGELGAAKDGWVVEHHLDELVEGAELVTASHGRPARYAAHRGSATLRRLAAAGLPVLEVPRRYVSSEETALIRLAHGGEAKPLHKPAPFVYGGRDSHGRKVRPTAVLNAETVWRISQVHRRGPEWFRSVGTTDEPGPRLVTVHGHVLRPGTYEAAAGMPLLALVGKAGGVQPGAAHVLVGGLGGVLLSFDDATRTEWSRPGLAPYGGSTGPGLVEVLDPTRCPWDVVSQLLAFGAEQTAGQCGPCMFGLPALAEDWGDLGRRPDRATWDRLRLRLGLVPGRGACRHPDGVARLAASALTALRPHLDDHARGTCHLRRSDER